MALTLLGEGEETLGEGGIAGEIDVSGAGVSETKGEPGEDPSSTAAST